MTPEDVPQYQGVASKALGVKEGGITSAEPELAPLGVI